MSNYQGRGRRRLLLALVAITALIGCNGPSIAPVDPYATAQPAPPLAKARYLDKVSFAPQDAKFFALVDQRLGLNADEKAMLAQNGFTVSDRLAFEDFSTAYAYIFWKDMPVAITTDSILQAIHQTHDDMLQQLEQTLLTSQLTQLLDRSLNQLRADARANSDPRLAPLYGDLETYLDVPLALLSGAPATTPGGGTYLQMARDANEAPQVTLFGGERQIDFTLFKPRGHYTQSEQLQRYFQAMSWLAQIDFRLVEYDPSGNPKLNIDHLAAAALLRDAIDRADQRATWQTFDGLFSVLVGRSDNTTLADLDRFMSDAQVRSADDIVHHPDPNQLLTLLTTRDYGWQRITGQLVYSAPGTSKPVPRPVSFMLLGQRFAVDSYLMSNLVYDRLIVDNRKIERALPSPLDVMYALGNDRAANHLASELQQYRYQGNLTTLRQTVDGFDQSFWTDSAYNRWLGALRALNGDTTGTAYPQALRTAAWADKMLHTQLASWAQLRHDNILYVKQSVTGMPLCEYPAGYVEPYPAFYSAVSDYARQGRQAFERLDPALLNDMERALLDVAKTYFAQLAAVADQLRTMAEKELRLEPFSADEEAFLRNTAVRHVHVENTCAGIMTGEEWAGWYPKLFPFFWKEHSPALIADVHTNATDDPGSALYPPRVLHVGTGPVAALLLIADTDEGPQIYVGPAFTYYEVVEPGFPPIRLTDEDWNQRLSASPRPNPPEWTTSFRLPAANPPDNLLLPTVDPATITPDSLLPPTPGPAQP